MAAYWRSLPSIAALLTLVVITAATFLIDVTYREKFRIETRIEALRYLSAFKSRLETELNKRLFLTRSLTNHIAGHTEINEAEFQLLARLMVDVDPAIRVIFLAPNNVISYVYPPQGNEHKVERDLFEEPGHRRAVERAKAHRSTFISGPLTTEDGTKVFVQRTPIFSASANGIPHAESYWGVLDVVVDAAALFEQAQLQDESLTMRFAIRGNDGSGLQGGVFYGDGSIFDADPITMEVSLPVGAWQVGALPRGGWLQTRGDSAWLWAGGLAFASLMSIIVWIVARIPNKLRKTVMERTAQLRKSELELQAAREELERRVEQRTAELLRTNEQLKDEISERNRTEDRLKRSEEKYRMIFENSPLGFFHFDGRGIITACNENFVKIIGSSKKELIGLDLLEDLNNEQIIECVKNVLGGLAARYEGDYQSVTAGRATVVKCYFAPLGTGDGQHMGGMTIVEDITEKRISQEARRESEERYRRLVEMANDIIYLTNAEGMFTLVNSVALKMTGYSQGELLGKHYLYFIHPEDRSDAERFYGIQFAKREPVTYHELRILTKSGTTIWLGQNVQLVENDGKLVGFQSICRDITDRKRAEEALQQSEEKYRTIIENIEEGYYEVSLDGNITFCNDALCKMFGYSREELISMNYRPLLDKNGAQHVYTVFNTVFTTGINSDSASWELITKGETRKSVEASVSLIRDYQGNKVGFRGICRDVSERKRTEELLLRSERLKAVGELASGVAHNFNNLLQIVMGGAQLAKLNLEMGDVNACKKRMEQIIQSSKLGSETVRRLQTFARLRSDFSRKGDVFDLSDTVRNAIEMGKVWWKSGPEKDGIQIKLSEHLEPACKMSGRENELFEVAVNLLKNAVEALPLGGEIQIQTMILNDSVVLTVADNGVGIPEEYQKKIFDPFFTTGGVQRTGMGLASSYGIIAEHGGEISVRSRVNQGTVFTITLPSAKSVRDEETLSINDFGDLKLRILIIDDVQPLLNMLTDGLTEFGQTVFKASSGDEGIRIFMENPLDLVICDLGMPGMTGWEVGKRIRQYCETRNIPKTPFIVLTGWAGQVGEKQRISESGVDTVLEKPVDVSKLLEVARNLLRKQ